MTVPARIGLITLRCGDMERTARVFRALGWPEAPSSDEHHTVFQTTNGAPIALWPTAAAPITLAINLASMEEVRAAYATLQQVDGVELLDEPTEHVWGGGFSFRDPEGNVWDVAWAEGSQFDDRGGLIFP
jgi:predicted lactoylglutathione lyase